MALGLDVVLNRVPILAAVTAICISGWPAGLVVLATTSLLFQWKAIWLIVRTLRRDLKAFKRYVNLLVFLRLAQFREKTPVMFFEEVAKKHPKKPMFHCGDRTWTFEEANIYTNRVANFFKERNLKAGDDVAIIMENCAELTLIWLGLAKIGVASALVNTNLRNRSLLHSISSVNAKAVIFTPTTAPSVVEISDELRSLSNGSVQTYCFGKHESLTKLNAVEVEGSIQTASATAPTYRGKLNDRLVYVYTSGTTGLPKAAIMKNYRLLLYAAVVRFLVEVKTDDVLYNYLPFYHAAGGMFGMSSVVIFGSTAAIAPKFSASKFWSECIRYKCTVTQYIGEICRYLHMQPPKPEDRKHSIRLMFGNGLKPTLWSDFIERFNIDDIRELYGSTEGNANTLNMDQTIGNVGFIPTVCRLIPFLSTLIWNRFIIKVDPETGKPLRGPDGLCLMCGPNEPGEWVATINNKRPELAFDGYTDKASSSKKTYTDVARKGDLCFATGDILEYDDFGYLYFRDRTGDTFRWKGENVSTTEVENVINKYLIMNDCVVYGVSIPGAEGKAGMVAILDPEGEYTKPESLACLLKNMKTELPTYAIPIVIRLARELEATGTYKLPKTKLVREAFNLELVNDPMFILDQTKQQYVAFDADVHQRLISGQWRA